MFGEDTSFTEALLSSTWCRITKYFIIAHDATMGWLDLVWISNHLFKDSWGNSIDLL